MLCVSFAAGQNDANIEALCRSHKWFELRDNARAKSSPYYSAFAGCAFNSSDCPRAARRIIQAEPNSEQAYLAHEALNYYYFRSGRYREALAEINAQLAMKPDKADLRSGAALLTALSEMPECFVERSRGVSRLRYDSRDGGLFIPLTIDGKPANYFVDTGLNISLISESEARRLGLALRSPAASASRLYGNAGGQIGFRIAVADTVTVGHFRLRNVVFLVIPDERQPFTDLPAGRRGGIGLPVLLGFRRIRWSREGRFEIGGTARKKNLNSSNLCFDGAMPLVEADFGHHKIHLFLDTGAEETELYPRFAREFADLIKASGAKSSSAVMGVDGSVKVDSVTLPELRLRIGGRETVLKQAPVLLKQTTSDAQQFQQGNLGMDLLRQARWTTLDFTNMRLTLR